MLSHDESKNEKQPMKGNTELYMGHLKLNKLMPQRQQIDSDEYPLLC